MATSNALRELEGLLDLEARGKAEAAQSARILEEDQREARRDPQKKARFATPEALATAVGAGWLLGPAGGILMGVAQGILGKREQQKILDESAQVQESLNASRQVISDELERARLTAGPGDQEALATLQAQLDMAAQYSLNPYMQEASAQLTQNVGDELLKIQIKNEEQDIAAAAEEARLQRELDARQYSDFTGLRKDYDSQSQGFENGRLAANKARDALSRGNPVDLVAATRLAIRTVEPTGPLTDADVAAYGRIGNVRDRLESLAEEWVGSGASLSDPMRRDFLVMINSFERENAALQMTRDLRFQELAGIAELPERETSYFNRVRELPVNLGGEFIEAEESGRLISPTGFSDQDILNNIAYLQSLLGEDTRTPEQKAADLQRYSRPGRD